MIRCRGCRRWKAPCQFNRQSKSRTGRQRECRDCAHLRLRDIYEALSPDEKRDRWRSQRAHRRENPEMYYWVRVRSRYGIERAQFEKLLADQGGVCAICRTDDPGGRYRQWCVDHDHGCCAGTKSCGKCVRGLLCCRCNLGLGSFLDDRDRLLRAVGYLDGMEHD
jgi:hypothetical protein